ncbi:hypothetical protein [Apilactobacillus micheneri]|nr:hypothetical protein [Apilactobacillus micheneri]
MENKDKILYKKQGKHYKMVLTKHKPTVKDIPAIIVLILLILLLLKSLF